MEKKSGKGRKANECCANFRWMNFLCDDFLVFVGECLTMKSFFPSHSHREHVEMIHLIGRVDKKRKFSFLFFFAPSGMSRFWMNIRRLIVELSEIILYHYRFRVIQDSTQTLLLLRMNFQQWINMKSAFLFSRKLNQIRNFDPAFWFCKRNQQKSSKIQKITACSKFLL